MLGSLRLVPVVILLAWTVTTAIGATTSMAIQVLPCICWWDYTIAQNVINICGIPSQYMYVYNHRLVQQPKLSLDGH